ncbi:methyltransferase-like protein 23 isoform X1 [Tripterygium wilfordii]|uniref:Methyltransferase-like protein 23 isoform X1 n=1 Tax=Tripterygium wilfordii TaxID=458696 RepID=A0A7J7CPL7_TRIWF|nr:uncharacterized protein LOC120015442 [Tripterygium wilfordii]KAF5735919.1 methyltransferase-like protein 23 isoform X1 [Tripterygium wilfordii]
MYKFIWAENLFPFFLAIGDFFATVTFLLQNSPGSVFITMYHNRRDSTEVLKVEVNCLLSACAAAQRSSYSKKTKAVFFFFFRDGRDYKPCPEDGMVSSNHL